MAEVTLISLWVMNSDWNKQLAKILGHTMDVDMENSHDWWMIWKKVQF